MIDSSDGNVDVLKDVAMRNAYLICHNVQVIKEIVNFVNPNSGGVENQSGWSAF